MENRILIIMPAHIAWLRDHPSFRAAASSRRCDVRFAVHPASVTRFHPVIEIHLLLIVTRETARDTDGLKRLSHSFRNLKGEY
jgi:hypothetical protein